MCLQAKESIFSKLTAGDIKEIFTVIWSFDRPRTYWSRPHVYWSWPHTFGPVHEQAMKTPQQLLNFERRRKGPQCNVYSRKMAYFCKYIYLGRVRYRAPHSANNVKLSFACWFRWEETCSRRLKMQRKSGRKVWKLFATFAIWQTLRLQAKAIDATFLSTLFLPTNFGH